MKALWYDMDIGKAVALQVGKLFTRNAAFSALSPFHYGDIPEPEIPNPRWLKVKNLRCGLCASDIHLIFMEISPKVFPAAVPGGSRTYLGHELVGEVVELGAEVQGFASGERVAQRIEYPACSMMEISPPCRQCEEGNYALCENAGLHLPACEHRGAGFSPVMVMHRSQPFHIPASLNGVFLGREATYREAERVCGARLLSAPFGNRILMGGFDVVFDTVGSDTSLQDSLRWARAHGAVVLLGVNLKPGSIDYSPVWYQEVDLRGAYAYGREATGETTFEIAARLLAEKRIPVDGLITHRFPVQDYRAAIRAFLSKRKSKAIKIVLEHA